MMFLMMWHVKYKVWFSLCESEFLCEFETRIFGLVTKQNMGICINYGKNFF